MTGSLGKEDSRQAKRGFGNWSVERSEGLWPSGVRGGVLLHSGLRFEQL